MPRLGGLLEERHTSALPGDKEHGSMRKADLVQRIAAELGCTIGQAEAAVEAILTTIKEIAPAGRARVPAAVWHVAGAGEAGARRSQPEDGRRGGHSSPAGRALCA